MKTLTSKIMQTGWAEVLERLIPPETHPQLVKTFKRFYFAGGQHLLHSLVYDAALDEGDEPTEGILLKIRALMHEINEYFTEVAAGRAIMALYVWRVAWNQQRTFIIASSDHYRMRLGLNVRAERTFRYAIMIARQAGAI